jgi:hypothetical protein
VTLESWNVRKDDLDSMHSEEMCERMLKSDGTADKKDANSKKIQGEGLLDAGVDDDEAGR